MVKDKLLKPVIDFCPFRLKLIDGWGYHGKDRQSAVGIFERNGRYHIRPSSSSSKRVVPVLESVYYNGWWRWAIANEILILCQPWSKPWLFSSVNASNKVSSVCFRLWDCRVSFRVDWGLIGGSAEVKSLGLKIGTCVSACATLSVSNK